MFTWSMSFGSILSQPLRVVLSFAMSLADGFGDVLIGGRKRKRLGQRGTHGESFSDAGPSFVASDGQRATSSSSCPVSKTFVSGQRTFLHTVESQPGKHGRPIVVALIATREGRWFELMCGDDAAARSASDKLVAQSSLTDKMEDYLDDARHDSWLIGFAVLQSWRLASVSCNPLVSCLRAMLSRHHARSSSLHYLEHDVLSVCALPSPIALDRDPHASDAMDLGQHCYTIAKTVVPSFVRGGCGSAFSRRSYVSVGSVLDDWYTSYRITRHVYAWPATYTVALSLCCGELPADVTALVPRDARRSWRPPVLPPRQFRRDLARTPGCVGDHLMYEVVTDAVQSGGTSAARKPRHSTSDLLNAVEFGCDLKDQRKFRDAAAKALRFFYPHDWKCRMQRVSGSGSGAPSGNLLQRSRVRMDVAAMLWHRSWSWQRALYRYVSMDASPQMSKSHEVFISAERVIERSALVGQRFQDVSSDDVSVRMLPIATLGQGKTSLSDKVEAHVHQTWCDYGPSVASVRVACHSVRQVLTDMGVEFGLADVPDVLASCIPTKCKVVSASGGCESASHLFPYALQVPGLLHILDWVVRETVQSLPWWPVWQSKAKRILQYCHSNNHRALLRQRVNVLVGDKLRAAQLAKTLVRATGRFAKWRWKTLMGAVLDLARVRDAVQCVARGTPNFQKEFSIRDGRAASALHASCLEDSTWTRASVIAFLIKHPMELMNWVQGCDCHESELLEGKTIHCCFKGCRAPGLWRRIQKALADMKAQRDSLSSTMFAGVDVSDVSHALSRAMVCLRMKLQWVNELPYLVWQASVYCNVTLLSCVLLLLFSHPPRIVHFVWFSWPVHYDVGLMTILSMCCSCRICSKSTCCLRALSVTVMLAVCVQHIRHVTMYMWSICCLHVVYTLYALSTRCLHAVYMLSTRCLHAVYTLSTRCLLVRLCVVCLLSTRRLHTVCGVSTRCPLVPSLILWMHSVMYSCSHCSPCSSGRQPDSCAADDQDVRCCSIGSITKSSCASCVSLSIVIFSRLLGQ